MAATTPNSTLPIESAAVPMFLPSRPVRTRGRTPRGLRALPDGRLRVSSEHIAYWRSTLPNVTIRGQLFPVSVNGLVYVGMTLHPGNEIIAPRETAVADVVSFLRMADRGRPSKVCSYRLKHSIERWLATQYDPTTRDHYIANGEAILGASRLGIDMADPIGPNVQVGISLKWLEAIESETEAVKRLRHKAYMGIVDDDDLF